MLMMMIMWSKPYTPNIHQHLILRLWAHTKQILQHGRRRIYFHYHEQILATPMRFILSTTFWHLMHGNLDIIWDKDTVRLYKTTRGRRLLRRPVSACQGTDSEQLPQGCWHFVDCSFVRTVFSRNHFNIGIVCALDSNTCWFPLHDFMPGNAVRLRTKSSVGKKLETKVFARFHTERVRRRSPVVFAKH